MKTKTRTTTAFQTHSAPALKSTRRTKAASLASSLPLTPATPPSLPTHAAITQRAHEIWMREGQPEGRAEAHWLQAERELLHGAV